MLYLPSTQDRLPTLLTLTFSVLSTLIPLGTYEGNGFITVVQNKDTRGLICLNDEFNTYALVFSVGPDDVGMSPPINTDGLGQVISPSLTDDLGRTKSNHHIHEKEPVCQVNCFIFAN